MKDSNSTDVYDIYDEAVASLRNKTVDQIIKIWNTPKDYPEGILFRAATKDGVCTLEKGCLTQVRNYWLGGLHYEAENDKLTSEIGHDERIPRDGDDINHDNLYVFAEWQRKLDKELGRSVPIYKV